MPNSYVFPGGSIDPKDLQSSEKWRDHFLKYYSQLQLDILQKSLVFPTVPKMYQNASNLALSKQILYRIAALREVAEETGVLLANNGIHKLNSTDQKLIHDDANQFLEYCAEHQIVPNIRRLIEWCIWLTPTGLDSSRRFDTMFYTLILDDQESTQENLFTHDGVELTNTAWGQPHEFLHDYENFLMHPPQAFELARMLNFKKVEDLEKYAIERQIKFGTQTWLPITRKMKDHNCNMTIMPGDYLYPTGEIETIEPYTDQQIFKDQDGYRLEDQFEQVWENRENIPGYRLANEAPVEKPLNRGFWFVTQGNRLSASKSMKSERILYVSNFHKTGGSVDEKFDCGHVSPVGFEDWPALK